MPLEATAANPGTTQPQPLDWVDRTKDTLSTVRTQAESWDSQVRSFAREKPLAAVLCAVAGGYVLARLTTWR